MGSVPMTRTWFGTVELMTESESARPELAAGGTADPLAARLLAAQRLLCTPDIDPDIRLKLQLRFSSICTSLKLPAVDRARGAERLDRLIADAERARCDEPGLQAYSDNVEPEAGLRDYL
jgi:hypothetical protein